IAVDLKTAQLVLRQNHSDAISDGAPPPHADFLAPELFRAEPATQAAVVFGIARLAATISGQRSETDRSAEAAWARLALLATGKHDPAREFLASAAAAALPVDCRELIARGLSRKRSRRVVSPEKFVTRLKELTLADWAQHGVLPCAHCGFVLAPEKAAQA